MKWLDGRDLAGFIQERHAGTVRSLERPVKLAIVTDGSDEASRRYVAAKQKYGNDIGVAVEIVACAPENGAEVVSRLGADSDVTGIIVQLPFGTKEQADAAIEAIPSHKDVDGLTEDSPYDTATPKGILWLLAGHNVDLDTVIAVVGQGRLVGKPLADMLEISNYSVLRLNSKTKDLAGSLREAGVIVMASGQAGLLTAQAVKPGTVIVDTGAPDSEVAQDVLAVQDIKITPNPGGVGPMTVAALFDNLLLAAQF